MQRLDLPPVVREAHALRGQVIYVDHFGNLATNVSAADLAGLAIHAPSIGVGASACAASRPPMRRSNAANPSPS